MTLVVIYSILPPEAIFGTEAAGPPPREFAVGGGGARILVQVRDGVAVVQRVASTDPRHFLEPHFQPGVAAPELPPAPPLWG